MNRGEEKIMEFYIRCESCMQSITVVDGYKNEDEIEIKITGESVVEFTCKSCRNSITAIDGNI